MRQKKLLAFRSATIYLAAIMGDPAQGKRSDPAQSKRFFHVQTCVDGVWGDFTKTPFEGENAAGEHLEKVQAWAVSRGKSKDDVRLRELSSQDIKAYIIALHPKEFYAYLLSLPIETFERIANGQTP